MRLGAFCQAGGSVAPAPCDITFNFFDTQGRTVKSSHLILPANSAGHLDLKWAELKTTASRVEIAPCWKSASGITVTGSAVPSFALLDSLTGLTIAQTYPAAPLSGGQ